MHRFDYGDSEVELVKMARDLERARAYSVLLTYSIHSEDYVLFLLSMIKVSKRLKFMMAFRSYSISPEYAIRFFNTMEKQYPGRVTFNLVAGKMLEDEEKEAIEMYNLDKSLMNTIEKRIDLLDTWANKFFNKMGDQAPISYTVGNSPITFDLANKWTDYVIVHESKLEESFNKAKNTKLVLCIDPLIRETKKELDSDIEYYYQDWAPNYSNKRPSVWEKRDHSIQGNMEEVKQQINDISQKYGIDDFMIVTNQKNVYNILKLIEEMSR
jgi:alkanesulfonate monooxygenase SsuD/methylene tetrahydromethanopterin reductase-like flavin-dependent oxidoreductase (luciferase family)